MNRFKEKVPVFPGSQLCSPTESIDYNWSINSISTDGLTRFYNPPKTIGEYNRIRTCTPIKGFS